jgi:hypothetical protein
MFLRRENLHQSSAISPRTRDRAEPLSRILRGVATAIHAAFISLNTG